MESCTDPPSIDFDFLMKLFPDLSEKNIRRRLTSKGAIFDQSRTRQGVRLVYKGYSKFGMCSLMELRKSFTPEQYCLNMSMWVNRERLRHLNYTDSMINPSSELAELEPEVLAAPWNTSKALLRAFSGKNYLDLKAHLVDPTGPQREGFSCVTWSKSPTEDEQIRSQHQLRDNTNQPKNSTQQAKIPDKNPLSYKIKREKLERLAIFQREAQIISEVQSKVLASKEVLSSDEGEDEREDDEGNPMDVSFDEQLRDLDKLVLEGQSSKELNFEKEEEERRNMMKEFCQNIEPTTKTTPINDRQASSQSDCPAFNVAAFKNKTLRIHRTYMDEVEGEIVRTEVVREPKIIALYVKQKGGSVTNSQSLSHTNEGNSDKNLNCVTPTILKNQQNRRNSYTLGPSELCRADGIRLTISKKVLDTRAMRKHRRDSRVELC